MGTRPGGVVKACACSRPSRELILPPRGALPPRGIIRSKEIRPIRKPAGMREVSRSVSERSDPERVRDVAPVILTGARGKCRPFLKVEKDAERFAACNALADELGPLDTPEKAFRVVEEAIGDEVNEVFGVITLDLHLRLKSVAETGRGEPTSVMAPILPTLQAAVIDGAHAVIIYHVHPSGVEAEPSDADIETTEAFAEAFDTIDVNLLDHLIAGGDIKNRSYYSFAEHKKL